MEKSIKRMRRLLFLFILCLCFSVTIKAQNLPFVEEGKVWHMVSLEVPMLRSPYYEFCYFIKGDTLISGVDCKKMYAYNEDNKNTTEYKMALFEQKGKVFFIPADSTNSFVLYDFDIPVGETATVAEATHPDWGEIIRMRNNEPKIRNYHPIHD